MANRRSFLKFLLAAPVAAVAAKPAIAALLAEAPAAVVVGRGLTAPIFHVDECGYRNMFSVFADRTDAFAEAFFPTMVTGVEHAGVDLQQTA